MWRLASAFVDIALHKRGPEHIPASQFLLSFVLVVYLLVGYASIRIGGGAEVGAVAAFVIDSLVYLLYVWAILKVMKRVARFRQTATALLGADVFFNVVGLPLFFWNRVSSSADLDATLPTLLILGLLIWSIDVAGYVISRALERPYIVGVLIVILYVMTSMSIRESLVPVSS